MRKWWRTHVSERQQARLLDYTLAVGIAAALTFTLVVSL
jgi:hypothetical protein